MILLEIGLVSMVGLVLGIASTQGTRILQDNQDIKKENREVAIIISSILNDLGMVTGHLLSLAFAGFILPYDSVKKVI